MTKTIFRRFIALGATTALAASLAACGPDDAQKSQTLAPLLTQNAAQPGWSMNDLASVDPAFLQANTAPLPQAVPMRAAYRGNYDHAPAFDYGPQPQYDDGYYADDVGPNDYQWLALASSLGGMLGAAPPDYAFSYGGVQPWAWETGDRYVRYAEPIDGGYRYYYYQPDSYTPYFVSDPYYSYGYRDDRLVAIYDNSGRVIDARRAERQRQAAQDYFARARGMYAAAHDEPRFGVAAPLWDRQRAQIVRQQEQLQQARQQRAAWQRWDAANEQRLHRDWASEALVRREAENRFAGWQQADYRTPAPQFYNQQQRQAQLQRLAAIRQQERQVAVQRAQVQQQQQALIAQRQAQQQVAQQEHQQAIAERQVAQQQRVAQQQLAQQQRQQEHLQQVAAQQQAQRVAQQQQVQAQREQARQQQQAQAQVQQAAHQRQVRAEQAKAQRQAMAERQQVQQQQARRAAEQRQQVARQQGQQQKQLAQRQEQQRQQQAAQQRQAQQARVEQQQKQAQARQAAQRQAQQQRVAEQQKQAQQARAAQQQKQAQQAQAARQQQKQAQAAKQQRQAQQAQAAKQQRSAEQAQEAPANGHGHGKGHDRG